MLESTTVWLSMDLRMCKSSTMSKSKSIGIFLRANIWGPSVKQEINFFFVLQFRYVPIKLDLNVMDAGDSVSIACKVLQGLPQPMLVLKRVDGEPVESKEQRLDEKENTLIVEFNRDDQNSYDANFTCIAKNKFEEASEVIFAGPGKKSNSIIGLLLLGNYNL